jgi:hypothetical protein
MTRKEREALIQTMLTDLDRMKLRDPKRMANFGTDFEDVLWSLDGYTLREHQYSRIYNDCFNERSKRAWVIAVRKFLRDRKARYARFLDPVWFDQRTC